MVDDVAAEVELGQRVEPLQVVHCLYQVVGEIQDSEVTQVIDIFDSTNFIRVQVQDVQFSQSLQIFDLLDVVFAEHEDAKSRNRVQIVDLFDMVVVKV